MTSAGAPDRSAPSWYSEPHHFVTVDAESAVIADGIRVISAIRERVETDEDIEIPIVWFVRFQRMWDEYRTIESPEHYAGPFAKAFDGFERAARELARLRVRNDQLGWHYHAYNYVLRDDLSHAHRVAILHADLAACAAEIRRRHGEPGPETMRFGWFFIPDYGLFPTLRAAGIRVDASVRPRSAGCTVASFQTRYLRAITSLPRQLDGIWFVPFRRTIVVHDWNVVPHDLPWTRQAAPEAAMNCERFEAKLRGTARGLKEAGGTFLTYERILGAARELK